MIPGKRGRRDERKRHRLAAAAARARAVLSTAGTFRIPTDPLVDLVTPRAAVRDLSTDGVGSVSQER